MNSSLGSNKRYNHIIEKSSKPPQRYPALLNLVNKKRLGSEKTRTSFVTFPCFSDSTSTEYVVSQTDVSRMDLDNRRVEIQVVFGVFSVG